MSSVPNVGALVFDVFGTVVDWRTSVTRQAAEVAKARGVAGDWARFADDWRAGYRGGMEKVTKGEWPWMKVDAIHRRRLEEILPKYGLGDLGEAERSEFNKAWHRLEPWPDSVEGLTRLKKRYIIGTLSNGNVSLLTNMAKHAGLPWDCILSAELAGHFKRDIRAYQKAVELLDLPAEQVMLVAAHMSDLKGAQKAGLSTALVIRLDEYGPDGAPDLESDGTIDVVASDFVDLAAKMGA
jgi:2-haloacid dehalogenase